MKSLMFLLQEMLTRFKIGNRWLTALTFEKTDFNTVMKALEEINVESRPLWKPMHMQPLFKECKTYLDGTHPTNALATGVSEFAVRQKAEEVPLGYSSRSEALFSKGLCVASSTTMTKDDVKRVCEVIRSSVKC